MNNNTPLSLFSGNTLDVNNRARVAGQFLIDETLGNAFLDIDSTNNGRLQLKDSTKVPIIGINNIQLFDEWEDDGVYYRNLNGFTNLDKTSNMFLNGSHHLTNDLYAKDGLYFGLINGYNNEIKYDNAIDNKDSVDGSSCKLIDVIVNGYRNSVKNFSIHDTLVNGYENELHMYISGSFVTGTSNTVADISNTLINGKENTFFKCNNSIINGLNNYSYNVCYVQNEGPYQALSGGLDKDYIYNNTSITSYSNTSGNPHPLEFGNATVINSIVTGRNNKLYKTKNSLIAGYELLIGNQSYSVSDSLIFGCFNQDLNHGYTSYPYMHNPVFVMGNGIDDSSRSNLAVFKSSGINFAATISSPGADYAEMFEWEDGNEEEESREGLFVTLEGDKIKIANDNDDYILGIVSANPAILGDSYFGDVWKDKFLRDEYGRYIYDDEGNKVLNPDYDPNEEYVNRKDRKEWDAVGLVGKLLVKDDGTCKPKKFCKVGKNGVATKSKNNTGWYVMKRINENLIQILFK